MEGQLSDVVEIPFSLNAVTGNAYFVRSMNSPDYFLHNDFEKGGNEYHLLLGVCGASVFKYEKAIEAIEKCDLKHCEPVKMTSIIGFDYSFN